MQQRKRFFEERSLAKYHKTGGIILGSAEYIRVTSVLLLQTRFCSAGQHHEQITTSNLEPNVATIGDNPLIQARRTEGNKAQTTNAKIVQSRNTEKAN